MCTAKEERFLLHIESQTRDDGRMLERMGFYHALLYDKFGLLIRHKVICLGAAPSRMGTRMAPIGTYLGFGLVSIWDFSMEELVASELVWEVVLAVLGDFREIEPELGVQMIVDRLMALPLSDTDQKKSLVQLKILGRLRELDSRTLMTLKRMPIDFELNSKSMHFFWKAGKKVSAQNVWPAQLDLFRLDCQSSKWRRCRNFQ